MAYNGMSSVPSITQRPFSLTASAFSSFQTPAITVPFPSVYGGQLQIPFTFSSTPTYASSRARSTIGGNAATAGIHSVNSLASEGGYRDHGSSSDGSSSSSGGGGGGGWPVWATAVIASVGGVILALTVLGLCCWRWKRKQRRKRERGAAMLAQTGGNRFNANHNRGGTMREKGGVLEKPYNHRGSRGYAAAAPAVGAAVTDGRRDSRRPQSQVGRSRQSNLTEYTPNSRAHPPPGLEPNPRHSRSQSRQPYPHRNVPHAAALGINRPNSAAAQFHPSQPQSRPPSQTPSGYRSAYPAFAAPRPLRQSIDSPTRSGHITPPPRHSESSFEGSPAQLLASHHRSQDSPRSSSQSTRYGYPDYEEVGKKLNGMQFTRERYSQVERGGVRNGYSDEVETRRGGDGRESSRASTSYDTAEEEEDEDEDGRGKYYGFAR